MTPTSPRTVEIEGTCDPAFSMVEAAFRENFRLRDEVGAAVCIRIKGRTVADLWGGHCDAARTRPWHRNTLVNAYSVGKGLTAMLVLSLVERGDLDLDEPIAKVWPDFGVEGKIHTTLRMLLSHRAGLPAVRRRLDDDAMLSWPTMCGALAEQKPYWEPGKEHGYHVNTFGFLVGEPVVRRLGMSFARAFRKRLAEPAEADFHIGLPTREHVRVAEIIEAPHKGTDRTSQDLASHLTSDPAATDAMLPSAYFNPRGLSGFGCVNTPAWRRASIPSTNGHGTARAVAALYDLFVNRNIDRGGLVGAGLRAEALRTHSEGVDRILGKPSRFGLGFQLSQASRPIGGSKTAFGHFGYGGTLGFADPETGVAFGYLMNRPGERWQTPRTNALVGALNEAMLSA